MVLLIEIILTVKAWKNGWKGWALWPLAIVLTLGFMLGMYWTNTGREAFPGLYMLGLFLDVTAITVLAVMTYKGPRCTKVDDNIHHANVAA